MTCKFLSLLFFCGVCIAAFGQELQSPQINQNAIFANPGLAGSKGQTRVCVNVGIVNITDDVPHNRLQDTLSGSSVLKNGLISADGLMLNKSVGIGAYLKYNTFQKDYHISGGYAQYTWDLNYDLSYYNVETGIVIAPKFYLTAKDTKKNDRSISPSFSIGVRSNQANLKSKNYYFDSTKSPQDSTSDKSKDYSNIELSQITAGFLYNTKKGYAGAKVSLLNVEEGGADYKMSFVLAHSFYNKKVEKPNFSFNPQVYISFMYFTDKNYKEYDSPFHVKWEHDASINLDFRYKSIIWGIYTYKSNWIYSSAGYTLGTQLKWARILLNFSPSFYQKNGLQVFLTTNFYIG